LLGGSIRFAKIREISSHAAVGWSHAIAEHGISSERLKMMAFLSSVRFDTSEKVVPRLLFRGRLESMDAMVLLLYYSPNVPPLRILLVGQSF
jgi:hypothetical protein